MQQTAGEASKQENPMLSIVFNIALPSLILFKLSETDRLGPVWALVLALAFPVGYGAWDFFSRRKHNFVSILGFVSVLLTGGFGLFQLDGIWFAVKEAAVPGAIAVVLVASLFTKNPLVKSFLYNDRIMDVAVVNAELEKRQKTSDFDRLLVITTWLLAASFVVSSVLNFFLAVYLLKSPSGTPAFNQELARMTALSYPVIVVPSMGVTALALWKLLSGIKNLTGLPLEQIFKTRP